MKNKKAAFILALFIVVFLYLLISNGQRFQEATVKRVIDGDTLILENGDRVRLIGINAPEKNQFYYGEAKEKLKEMVEGKVILLESDRVDKDKYGRLLRYVYLNKTNVNLYLVLNGYAISYPFEENEKYLKKFEAAERIAKDEKIGIWVPSKIFINNESVINCFNVTSFHWDAEGNDNLNLNDEYVTLQNLCNFPINLSGWDISDRSNKEYIFKNFVLKPGKNFTLYSGKGNDNENSIFWGRRNSVWYNGGDALYLRDTFGGFVIEKSY